MKQIAIVCAAMALAPGAQSTGQAAAQQVAHSYIVATLESTVYVVTHRTGLLSFLGHDHAILATEWSGSLCWTPVDPRFSHGSVEIAASALVIDTDSARAVAGLGKGPSPGQVRGLQAKLLDSEHLNAARFSTLTLSVDRVADSLEEGLVAQGRLTIRDQVRQVEFPIVVAIAPESVRVSGVLRVLQSDFGIRPESVAAVVKVADRVDIHFDLLAIPTNVACVAPDSRALTPDRITKR